MSVNAVVYCDCIESGRVKVPHPRPALLFINQTGAPDISSADPRDVEAHDRWESLRPCQHEHFWLIERWLGNVSLLGSIREVMKQYSRDPARDYPVLYTMVIRDGSHSGDFLTSETVGILSDEIKRLSMFEYGKSTHLAELLGKLKDLVQASLKVNKPISF